MRVLTVRQPYAWAIIHGGKDVENRSRNVAGGYRGPVAIHAGTADDLEAWAAFLRTSPLTPKEQALAFTDRPLGAIIGVVDLVNVHACASHRGDSDVPDCADSGTPLAMTCSPWAQFTPGEITHHIVLANPCALATPIPVKGRLGVGLWHPDPDLEHAITAALAITEGPDGEL